MSNVLVRDLPDETVMSLKRLAEAHGRSMAEELRAILNAAAQAGRRFELPEPRTLKGRKGRSVAEVLLEDRR